MPLHEARQISIELHLKRLSLRWFFCEGYSDWRGNGFGRRMPTERTLGFGERNAGCWFCLCGDDPKVSNGYVVQAYYWKGNRMNSQWIPILNIFNFPPVLKQITLYRRGATNPHPLWGPERSGPCTSSPQRRLGQAVWPCNPLVGFFSSVVKIVTSRWYKVLSAQDLTREGGYGPPYAVRWFA